MNSKYLMAIAKGDQLKANAKAALRSHINKGYYELHEMIRYLGNPHKNIKEHYDFLLENLEIIKALALIPVVEIAIEDYEELIENDKTD